MVAACVSPMRTICAWAAGMLLGTSGLLFAQAAPPSPPPVPTSNSITVSGSLRTRVEAWSWFDGTADDDYAYSGSIARLNVRGARKRLDWNVEFAAPFLLGLPDQAIAPAPQGQSGLGASYYAANDNHQNTGSFFLKQGFVRFKDLGGRTGQALTAGRFEFVAGVETAPADPTLAALKRDRIAHRLLGTFAFSHVGRSFDGVQYSSGGTRVSVTGLVARPTEGVFQADGWDELDINVFYGAVTGQTTSKTHPADWRVFALGYHDDRDIPVKTDNRPLAVRRADTKKITVTTFGGHYVSVLPTDRGPVDLLVWAAGQAGSWGALSHRAFAFAAEGGWQPAWRLRPWIRGGWNVGSGDGDATDDTHGTFFQVLPTPRVYARFPFFNMMNSSDAFAELVLRLTARVTTRLDVHRLWLSSADDLWYQGGGAFEHDTFGYAGRPSNGSTSLATLLDGGVEYNAGPHAAVGGYYGAAWGGGVVKGTYPAGQLAQFGYVELPVRF